MLLRARDLQFSHMRSVAVGTRVTSRIPIDWYQAFPAYGPTPGPTGKCVPIWFSASEAILGAESGCMLCQPALPFVSALGATRFVAIIAKSEPCIIGYVPNARWSPKPLLSCLRHVRPLASAPAMASTCGIP
jgi:hypothetical protein